MNTKMEIDDKKLADKMLAKARQSGQADDYMIAAQLYEQAGYYASARQCREAAEALSTIQVSNEA